MDMENNATKQAYIQLLIDTLEKKKKVLGSLMNVTEQQEGLMTLETFDDNLFNQTISIKEEHLKTLTMLDEGFERAYDGVKNELTTEKEKYKEEIIILKELVTFVTNLSVKLQALEQRNKSKMEFLLSQKRKGIKDSRVSNKTVANYYKSMAQQQEVPSVFYDKKK